MRLFYLSSKNRSSGTSSNFVVPLTRLLSLPEGARFRIDQLRLGVAFMLVNATNRYIYFFEGPNVRIATLEIGQYSSESLATTLAFVMSNAPHMQGSVAAAYSTISGSTTLTYAPPSSNPSWTISILTDAQVAQEAPLAYSGVDINNPQSFASVLGSYTSARNGNSTVLTFRFISTQPYDVLFLCSLKLGSWAIQGPRGNCDTLMQIAIEQQFGGVQQADMPVDVWISCGGISTHDLDFQLQDAQGNVVDMSLGGEISFLLSIDDGDS